MPARALRQAQGERLEVQAQRALARGERIGRVRCSLPLGLRSPLFGLRSRPFGLSLSKPARALRQAQGERLEVQAQRVLARGERIGRVRRSLPLGLCSPLFGHRSRPFGLSLSKPARALRQAQGERLQPQAERLQAQSERLQAHSKRLKAQAQQTLAQGQRMQFQGGRLVHPLDQVTGACR
jgi:hypothetical protein